MGKRPLEIYSKLCTLYLGKLRHRSKKRLGQSHTVSGMALTKHIISSQSSSLSIVPYPLPPVRQCAAQMGPKPQVTSLKGLVPPSHQIQLASPVTFMSQSSKTQLQYHLSSEMPSSALPGRVSHFLKNISFIQFQREGKGRRKRGRETLI